MRCSRNARLSPESRSNALSISAALKWAQQAVAQGEVVQADAIVATVQQRITAAGGDVDYVQVRLLLLSQLVLSCARIITTRCLCIWQGIWLRQLHH